MLKLFTSEFWHVTMNLDSGMYRPDVRMCGSAERSDGVWRDQTKCLIW